jgi:hypothetical protein
MADVMPVNALGKQSFATALPPARQSGPSALGLHPRAKTVLAFTRSFRWLVSAFHDRDWLGPDPGAVTVGEQAALSTAPSVEQEV